jgi:hypothetical protein
MPYSKLFSDARRTQHLVYELPEAFELNGESLI